jgi:benzylsuccinate synthase
MAAVKYMIYDKKKYTMAELLKALRAEWEGYEDMRAEFKQAPKWGNNDDMVDALYNKMVQDLHVITTDARDLNNDPIRPSGLVITWMYHLAGYTGAMPNGRKRGEPLADGSLNPHAEFDKSGPWGRLLSAMKLDQKKFRAWIYNQKFDYASVAGEAGLDKLVEYTMAGMEGSMDQVQYNLQSKEALHDAQKNPEKYPFLAVRISGYSAYFTQLPEYIQDAVIDRVDHEL